jgi:hypothetical protein
LRELVAFHRSRVERGTAKDFVEDEGGGEGWSNVVFTDLFRSWRGRIIECRMANGEEILKRGLRMMAVFPRFPSLNQHKNLGSLDILQTRRACNAPHYTPSQGV